MKAGGEDRPGPPPDARLGLHMPDKSLERLRALLKSYEERTPKAPAAVKPAPGDAERRRQACGDRLQRVVRPVLQRFLDELKNAGHEAAIDDHTDTADAYPSVTLAFPPHPSGAPASRPGFRENPLRGTQL